MMVKYELDLNPEENKSSYMGDSPLKNVLYLSPLWAVF